MDSRKGQGASSHHNHHVGLTCCQLGRPDGRGLLCGLAAIPTQPGLYVAELLEEDQDKERDNGGNGEAAPPAVAAAPGRHDHL
jgi:hypothetical protein